MAMTMAMAMGESRGSIAFFGTYRPPIPLDIFSSTGQHGVRQEELLLTDGESYNQNGEAIPPAALRELLTYLCKSTNSKLLLAPETCTPEDAENGRVTGLLFVSERDDGLETLHVALRFAKDNTVKVLRLADIYGADAFGGVRMEDSGCIAGGFKVAGGRAVGHSLVYVSTKEAVKDRRAPWTVVYKTNLADGSTERLTPPGQYDLSPAVSPSGKTVAVANFRFNEWTGEIEHLNTDIVVMNVDRQAQGGLGRRILIRDAGWPSWGSDNVIFFHRGIPAGSAGTRWRVFRYDLATGATDAVTPEDYFVAITPAAISETKVAVATIRRMSKFSDDRVEAQYRHIEVFDVSDDVRGGKGKPLQVTSGRRPKADHYNPFVLDGGRRVGYHRCRTDRLLEIKDESQTNRSIERKFDKVRPPASHQDVGLFRVSGVFPTVSKDGRKLAFVDNEFKTVWLADGDGLRDVYTVDDGTSIFSTSWNQKDALDILYVCQGPAFSAAKTVEIYILQGVSGPKDDIDKRRLTAGGFNNAFPSSSPDGTMLVFRSTRDRVVHADAADKETQREYKNLFVMNATTGEFGGGGAAKPRQLTDGEWTDTHCSWSPREGCGWIVFSSTRDKPNQKQNVPPLDQGLDPGYFAVYLVNADDLLLLPDDSKLPAPVRVIRSSPTLAGHINHPVFSPDMRTIVFAADLAAVSCEPISMPLFLHSVRPYGDIFSVDLRDTNDVARNKDIAGFHRITHSRYEYSTPAWAAPADGDDDPNSKWKLPNDGSSAPPPACPYAYPAAGEGWYVAGHITVERRCC